MEVKFLQKWYTRIVGVFFVFVLVSLINELMGKGNTPEVWHKSFHVILGALILHFGWDSENFWKPFCLINGAFFLYIALFGWVFPDFAGLDAFSLIDTILHSIVGVSGLAIGFWGKNKIAAKGGL